MTDQILTFEARRRGLPGEVVVQTQITPDVLVTYYFEEGIEPILLGKLSMFDQILAVGHDPIKVDWAALAAERDVRLAAVRYWPDRLVDDDGKLRLPIEAELGALVTALEQEPAAEDARAGAGERAALVKWLQEPAVQFLELPPETNPMPTLAELHGLARSGVREAVAATLHCTGPEADDLLREASAAGIAVIPGRPDQRLTESDARVLAAGRDPRVDPRPGDVLDDDPPLPPWLLWTCSSPGHVGAARYTATPGHESFCECDGCACVASTTWTLEQWAAEMADAVVLYVSPDGEPPADATVYEREP